MEHTKIITAEDLSRYAERNESRGVIPELVYLLVRQSLSHGDNCRIPYGDSVNQTGLDGNVECAQGFFQFIPKGRSYWEIGTGGTPQDKATKDFRKRTKQIDDDERQNTTFVFVTPRSSGAEGWEEAKQRRWINRRKDKGWKDIRIIDGVKLADWLREFPAIAQWLAVKMEITPKLGGIKTPLEHWQLILDSGDKIDPPLPPELFIVSRENACNELKKLFLGEVKRVLLSAESKDDVNDFIAAYVATLGEAELYKQRCLFISDVNAWRAVAAARSPHILVADTILELEAAQMDLQTEAVRNGHGVVIPLCGALLSGEREIIKLRSPSRDKIEEVLRTANFSNIRARELAGIGGGRLSALRRHLLGLGDVPTYATWETAPVLARIALLGQWSEKNSSDLEVLKQILGNGFGEWMDKRYDITLQPDTPLAQIDGKWRIVPRSEAWNALGNRLADEDLDRFQEIALLVLSERDPKFDLPKEERYAANVLGKDLTYSTRLRKGIAETLALLGSRHQALSQCSRGKAETVAARVVHNLFCDADWERWAGLDSLMPLLAEAAPKAFLDAVEKALSDLCDTPFREVFAQEGGGLFGGENYISGLLWGLECLAWSPEYLARTAVILAELASIDPGGRYSNRPAQSLADIFLPWHIQTTASFEQRETALKEILKEQPNVGWKILLSLLPNNLGATSGCYRPVWRNFIPSDWEDGVLVSEYWAQIHMLAELAAEMAHSDVERLMELMDRLSDLPQETQEVVLKHLMSDNILRIPESERVVIWEKLDGLVRRHRKFSDAQWALPKETITKIEKIANNITPADPMLRYRYLFSESDHDLFDEKGKHEEQRERLDEKRRLALAEIMGDGDFARCLDFAQKTAMPYKVGQTLGGIASDRVEAEILPSQLTADDEVVKRVVAGFVWARFWQRGIHWVDSLLQRNWKPEQCARFLVLLPFQEEIWERVSSYLGKSHEGLYWKHVNVQIGRWNWDAIFVIEKLIAYGRAGTAVMCLAHALDDEEGFDPDIVTRALMAVLENPQEIEQLERYDTIALIKRLQLSTGVDIEALYQIEWNFLPWFDRLSGDVPVALEKCLASDPAFFAEMIKYAFRSKNDSADSVERLDEKKQSLAEHAYTLLDRWSICPGMQEDGALNEEAFRNWITEARRITEESGHDEIAQAEIGKVLIHVPADPGGLWIHKSVAAVLNERTTERMRFNFRLALRNQRGIHSFSHGVQERELARGYRGKAEAVEMAGFVRLAATMRELADQYDEDAARDENRDPLEEYS